MFAAKKKTVIREDCVQPGIGTGLIGTRVRICMDRQICSNTSLHEKHRSRCGTLRTKVHCKVIGLMQRSGSSKRTAQLRLSTSSTGALRMLTLPQQKKNSAAPAYALLGPCTRLRLERLDTFGKGGGRGGDALGGEQIEHLADVRALHASSQRHAHGHE